MKKTLSLIILLMIIFSSICYEVFIKRGHEEVEVLNEDVSVNNIKSIIDIKNEINEEYEEVPLGYNNGNIYLIKYDSVNKKLYDNNIFILNKDGTTIECGLKLSDDYSNCELNVYGDKIFGRNGYFNWQSGKEYTLLSDENHVLTTNWYSISGNNDYYLCVQSDSKNKKYTLYNINNNDGYKYECSLDSENVITGIFYDEPSKNFYAICQNNVIKEINFTGNNLTLENYDTIKINTTDNEVKNKDISNNHLNYTYSLEGQAYVALDYNMTAQNSINLHEYDIANKFTEQLNNITLYGYDNFYKEYILIKKEDDKGSNKVYLAKLEKNGFDMLIEIPKIYGDDSTLSIQMVNSENVLVKEENHNKENKKIKNRYMVYDLAQYFQENTAKSKSDTDKLTLKNAYKNINEFNDYDSNNKNKINEENKNTQEIEQPKSTVKDDNINMSAEKKDYREYDSSWRKGNGEWYYYKDNDEKVIGWLKTQKGWYYFYKDGTMQKNVTVIGKKGKEYKLGNDGLLLNPDSELDYNYDEAKENSNKDNKNTINSSSNVANNAKDTSNVKSGSNTSTSTKDNQLNNNNNNNSSSNNNTNK